MHPISWRYVQISVNIEWLMIEGPHRLVKCIFFYGQFVRSVCQGSLYPPVFALTYTVPTLLHCALVSPTLTLPKYSIRKPSFVLTTPHLPWKYPGKTRPRAPRFTLVRPHCGQYCHI